MEGAFRNSSEAVVLNTRPISYREASPSILFREPDGYSEFRKPATKARADDTDQGERLGGVHAVLYSPAIGVLKRGEGGGFGIKGGIKRAGRNGKSLCGNGLLQGSIPPAPASANFAGLVAAVTWAVLIWLGPLAGQ